MPFAHCENEQYNSYTNYIGDGGGDNMHRNYDLRFSGDHAVPNLTDDELFVNAWLSKINFKQNCITKPKPKINVKLHVVKASLKRYMNILENLEKTQLELKCNVATMSSEEWKKKSNEIGVMKDELSIIITQFNNWDFIKSVKYVLKKRSKKRINQGKSRAEARLKREREKEERLDAHKKVDKWLEKMKEEVERAKAEENMKKDADCVLSEVTKKKSDGKKQLGLITALNKLRQVREQMAENRGEKLSVSDKNAFNKAVERLTQMWENSMRIYSKEEQGLRIMLEQNVAEEVRNSVSSKDKQIAQEWENILYGPSYIPSPLYWGLTSAERDFETFVAIRKSWDTFLVKSDDGTKIPIGWVMPNSNPNHNWSKYLQE